MLEKRRTEVEILVSLKNKKLINKDRVAKKKKKLQSLSAYRKKLALNHGQCCFVLLLLWFLQQILKKEKVFLLDLTLYDACTRQTKLFHLKFRHLPLQNKVLDRSCLLRF